MFVGPDGARYYNEVGENRHGRVKIAGEFRPVDHPGGLFGSCYDVIVAPGSCQAWARASGKWAAEDAIENYLPTLS